MTLDTFWVVWRKLTRLIIILVVFLILAWLAHVLKTLFIMLLVGGGIAFILDPVVQRLSAYMRRGLAIAMTYLALIATLGVGVGYMVPRIAEQIQHFEQHLPQFQHELSDLTGRYHEWYDNQPDSVKAQVDKAQQRVEEEGKGILQGILGSVLGVLGWIGKGMIMLVLSIYLLVDEDLIRHSFLGAIPHRYRNEVRDLVGEILSVLRAYLRGQLVVIAFVAVSVTVALLVGGIPYALTIGTMAGILEVIPYFGAAAGAVPAVILGYMRHAPEGNGFIAAGLLILFFVCINQIEGHLVIPFVMGRTMEMRPLAVLLSLLVGAEVAGIPGLIVAVPAARILQILVTYLVRAWQQSRDDGDSPSLEEEVVPSTFAEESTPDPPPPAAPSTCSAIPSTCSAIPSTCSAIPSTCSAITPPPVVEPESPAAEPPASLLPEEPKPAPEAPKTAS